MYDVTLTQISVKCERSEDLLSWGFFQLLHKGYLQTPINDLISMGLWCSALLGNPRAKMSLQNNMNAIFIQNNLSSCFIFNYSIHCADQ